MCSARAINQEQERKNREEACKTFVEQTKQLITLASAFIFAPAAVQIVFQLSVNRSLVSAELLFIVSVLAGYVTLATITGTQFSGDFDVYRPATRLFGYVQFCAYLVGLILFMYWFTNLPPRPPSSPITQGVTQSNNNQNQGATKVTGEQNSAETQPNSNQKTAPENTNQRTEQTPPQKKATENQ